MGVCEVYDKLPEPLQRIVLRLAALRYLDYLLSNKMYDEVVKFLVSHGDKLGLNEAQLRELIDIARFNAAARKAENVLKSIMDHVERLEPIPESLKSEARSAARELLASISAWIPLEAREKAKVIINILEDVENIDRMIRLKSVVEAYKREIEKLFERMKSLVNEEARYVRRGDYEDAKRVYERIVDVYEESRRLLSRLREFIGIVKSLECRSDVCRRVRSAILGAAERLYGFLDVAPRLLRVYAEVLYRLVHAAKAVEDAFRRLESVDNPLKALDDFKGALYAVATLKKSLHAYVEAVRRIGGLAARYGIEELVRNLLSRIETFIENYASGIVRRLEDALVKAAAHNDDFWKALEDVYRDVGLAVPDRPEVPPQESIMDFVRTWLARFDFEQEVYAKAAERAHSVAELLWTAALATLTAFAKHTVGMLASIPEFLAEAARETLRDIQLVISGKLEEALRRRAEFIWKTIESMIPHPKNIYDAIGFVAALVSLGYLLGEAGIPLPKGLARNPVARTLLGEKLTVFSIVDLVAPEIGLALRAASEAISKATEKAAEKLREIAERLKAGDVKAVLAELGERIGEFEVRGEAVGELLERMKKSLEERLAKYIGEREAAALAARILEDVAARLRGKPRLSDLIRAVEEAVEREGPVAAAMVIEELAGVRGGIEELRRSLSEALVKLYRADTLTELREALTELKRAYTSASRIASTLRELREFIRRVLGEKAARNVDELYEKIVAGDVSALAKAEEIIRRASGLMGKVDEAKRVIAETVRRLTGDERAAQLVLKAESPVDAARIAIDAILRESRSPLRALDEFLASLEKLWREIEPLLARLALDLGGAFTLKLEQVVGAEIARKPIVSAEELPAELRRLLEEVGFRKARFTLEELAEALEALAKKVPDLSIESLQALRKGLEKLGLIVKEAEDVAVRIGRRDLALELERRYETLRSEVTRRLEYVFNAYKPLIESLREAARLAKEAGVREAAELLEKAIGVLPRADEAYRLIREALSLLRERAKPGVLERIASVLKRGARRDLLGEYAREILEMIREIEEAGGYVVRIGAYEVKWLRGLDAKAAEALAREITRGTWSETVRVGPYAFKVSRRVVFRPNRMIVEWRVEAPGGYWLRVREVFDVVCKGGECYARTARIVAYDPRLEGNPEAISLLEYAAARAIRDDPLAKLGGRVLVVLEGGARRRLGEILEALADFLEKRAGNVPRLLEELREPVPLTALQAVLQMMDEVGREVTIGGVTRRLIIEPFRIIIVYRRGSQSARIIVDLEGVKLEGNPFVLIDALRLDEKVRDLLRRLVKTKTRISIEDITKTIVNTIAADHEKIHIVPPDVLAEIISALIINPRLGNIVKVRVGNLVIPVLRVRAGSKTFNIALVQPEAIQVATKAPQPQPPSGERGVARPPAPTTPLLSVMIRAGGRVAAGVGVAEELVL